MSSNDNVNVIKSFYEAIKNRNWDQLSELFAESFIYKHPMLPGPVKDFTGVRKSLEGMANALDFQFEQRRIFQKGELCVAEMTVSGTHKGPLQLPNGSIPATNKSFKTEAASVFKLKNGKITEWQVYTDRMDLLTQLGIRP